MHAFDGWTDRRTDRRTDGNPIAIPRLHFMQRGKNAALISAFISGCDGAKCVEIGNRSEGLTHFYRTRPRFSTFLPGHVHTH